MTRQCKKYYNGYSPKLFSKKRLYQCRLKKKATGPQVIHDMEGNLRFLTPHSMNTVIHVTSSSASLFSTLIK